MIKRPYGWDSSLIGKIKSQGQSFSGTNLSGRCFNNNTYLKMNWKELDYGCYYFKDPYFKIIWENKIIITALSFI